MHIPWWWCATGVTSNINTNYCLFTRELHGGPLSTNHHTQTVLTSHWKLYFRIRSLSETLCENVSASFSILKRGGLLLSYQTQLLEFNMFICSVLLKIPLCPRGRCFLSYEDNVVVVLNMKHNGFVFSWISYSSYQSCWRGCPWPGSWPCRSALCPDRNAGISAAPASRCRWCGWHSVEGDTHKHT